MISEHSNTESQKNLNSFWSINILNKNENNDSKNGNKIIFKFNILKLLFRFRRFIF